MITEEMIKERISVIEGDIEKITKDISDAERKKTESISLLNALTGAKQQCKYFAGTGYGRGAALHRTGAWRICRS